MSARSRWAAATGLMDRWGERFSEDQLIRFDHRVFILLAVAAVFFVAGVACQLNGSSFGRWDHWVPQAGAGEEVLVGAPKEIRSDEWLVMTPFIMSQSQTGFPLRNPAIGAHSDPLLIGAPVNHFSTMLRPQNWGFFVLGAERGFSFFWGAKVFGLLLGSFFLLMLITGNRFWLSLAGAVWLFFSGFMQWFFSTQAVEMLAAMTVAIVAATYLMYSGKKPFVTLAAGVLIFAVFDFALSLYPPFQVPLFYLALFLLAGIALERGRPDDRRVGHLFRVVAALGAVTVLGALLLLYFRDARESVAAITATVYPGQRVSAGGGFGLVRMFSGFTGIPYSETAFPESWGNAPESSSFFLLFPVVMLAVLGNLYQRLANRFVVVALCCYLVLLSAWMLLPVPALLGKITLMSSVPPYRAPLGLGVASILLVIVWLAGAEPALSKRLSLGMTAIVAAGMIFFSWRLGRQIDGFFSWPAYLGIIVAVTLISWLLLQKRRAAFAVLLLLVAAVPNLLVNPVSAGLGGLLEKDVYRYAQQKKSREPDARWLTYGNQLLPQLFTAAGLDVVNGYKYTPDLRYYGILDPAGTFADVYNRYSAAIYVEPPNIRDEQAVFSLPTMDSIHVTVTPCSGRLSAAGVDYFVFPHDVSAGNYPCLKPDAAFPESGVWVYKRVF